MKILVIGYGSIGKRHVSILSTWSNIEIDIVSKQTISEYKTYKDLSEITDMNNYDYFIISSPTNLHYQQLVYIDERVLNKIILVEKPVFDKYKDYKSKNKVYVAYNLRFHPVLIKLKELINKEDVISVDVKTGQYLPTWRPGTDYTKSYSADVSRGGGVLLDLSHEIDYLLWLFGDIETIHSINKKISNLEISSDDFVTAIGFFKNGIIFNFSMDYLLKESVRKIIVNTNNTTIFADIINCEIKVVDISGNKNLYKFENIDRNLSYLQMHKTILNFDDFSQPAIFEDGLKVLSLVSKIREENFVSE